jgi:Flp pilus assembly protein TadD
MTGSRVDRSRIAALVIAAVAVAVVVVIVARATTGRAESKPQTPTASPPLPGLPLVALPPIPELAALASASDPTRLFATLLRSQPNRTDVLLAVGAQALEHGNRQAAETAFRRAVTLRDPAGAVALAVAQYDRAAPQRTLARLATLTHGPAGLFAQYETGVIDVWAGRLAAATTALRGVRAADSEGFYGTKADDLLHPTIQPGYPFFVPEQPAPSSSIAVLARLAQTHPNDPRALVDYGAALQLAGRRREASGFYQRALASHPNDVEAQVALAVSEFQKDDNGTSVFAQLGPLTEQFPNDPSARFHLALLLVWIGQRTQAKAQFAQVVRSAPTSRLGQLAGTLAGG